MAAKNTPLSTSFLILFDWASSLPGRITQFRNETNCNVVDKIYAAARNCCTKIVRETAFTPGNITEIDESLFGKHKYHKGRMRESMHCWVFGIFQRDTKLAKFFVVGDSRTTDTLLPLIEEHIPLTCPVFSDKWSSYTCLTQHGYVHCTVNHSENFVSHTSQLFDTAVHTQHIESTLNAAKAHFRLMRGCSAENRQSYLDQYTVFKIYDHKPRRIFEAVLAAGFDA